MNASLFIKYLLPLAFAFVGVTTFSEIAQFFESDHAPVPSPSYYLKRYNMAVADSDSLSRVLDSVCVRVNSSFQKADTIEAKIVRHIARIGDKRRRPVLQNTFGSSRQSFQVRFTSTKNKIE